MKFTDIEKVKMILESINELSKASEENTFEKIVKDASYKDKVKFVTLLIERFVYTHFFFTYFSPQEESQ